MTCLIGGEWAGGGASRVQTHSYIWFKVGERQNLAAVKLRVPAMHWPTALPSVAECR